MEHRRRGRLDDSDVENAALVERVVHPRLFPFPFVKKIVLFLRLHHSLQVLLNHAALVEALSGSQILCVLRGRASSPRLQPAQFSLCLDKVGLNGFVSRVLIRSLFAKRAALFGCDCALGIVDLLIDP